MNSASAWPRTWSVCSRSSSVPARASTDPMPNRLILDTDGGVDDAQALLLLIANGRPPDAITTVFGNVDLDMATKNVLSALAVAGVTIDVHMGAPEPLEEEIVIHAR